MMKEKKINWLLLISILFLLLGVLLIVYFYLEKSNECINHPFVYGSKKLTKLAGYEFVGSGRFIIPFEDKLTSPTYVFNSTHLRKQNS